MGFDLPDLRYAYDALEPHIDAETMELHHSKHHAGYTAKLNAAIKGTNMAEKSIEELLTEHNGIPAVRNNGGGYWNHNLFWRVMSPDGGGSPDGDLAIAIDDAFGSIEGMKDEFTNSAISRFGSGWAWLCSSNGSLFICSSPNQDNPLISGNGIPILGLDLWEHAYYKKFGPARGDYITAWWNVVDWGAVAGNYTSTQ
ncbi:MAG: superoxide dismutase [Euryarchaeota archaeon]|nr:superoxide dismutase [Euryarchaeota archaeon]MDP6221079.1 superoxide dismutase [Candidatus Thalassarchaeaceae archaeon]MDP7649401.1 superoxide dismutase [Candidatus Thalassarchaeaceae archaeon]HJM77201.1 superoxide dismutase [Candidatus Thalassarchaeaceae archaeon]HJO84297.1 superoxide dismutase [Candidatus Thalassarchaeaceae archaeon]